MPSLNSSFRKLLRWQSETISISIVSVPLLVSTFENSPYALPVLLLKYFSVFAEFNLCKFVAGLHVAACQNKVDFNVVKLTKTKIKKNCVSSFLPSAATFIKKYCIVYIDGEEEGRGRVTDF